MQTLQPQPTTQATDRRPHGNAIATAALLLPVGFGFWWAIWHYCLAPLF